MHMVVIFTFDFWITNRDVALTCTVSMRTKLKMLVLKLWQKVSSIALTFKN